MMAPKTKQTVMSVEVLSNLLSFKQGPALPAQAGASQRPGGELGSPCVHTHTPHVVLASGGHLNMLHVCKMLGLWCVSVGASKPGVLLPTQTPAPTPVLHVVWTSVAVTDAAVSAHAELWTTFRMVIVGFCVYCFKMHVGGRRIRWKRRGGGAGANVW